MSEEVDKTAAETALLLHENIEMRIHEAVGRLFGYDVVTHTFIPRVPNHNISEEIRQSVNRELSRYVASSLLYDTPFIEQLFNQMETIQHNRRMQHRNSQSAAYRYF
jgi:uncharacterized protein (UPF0332 family)